jgi:phage tail sheath protein FI
MPVTPTYPGVYIEEIPSGVRTITGVSTSVTAFIGQAKRGPINEPVSTQSFADFERIFGGLDAGSEMSYAVRYFFQNGGAQAYVVRIAMEVKAAFREDIPADADEAGNVLTDEEGNALNVLTVTALQQGNSGNAIEIRIDHETPNPASTFNMTISRAIDGDPQSSAVEKYFDLTMNANGARYVEDVINGESRLVKVERASSVDQTVLNDLPPGTSESGPLEEGGNLVDVAGLIDDRHNQFRVSINGQAPITVQVSAATDAAGAGVVARLASLCAAIQHQVRAAANGVSAIADFTCTPDENRIVMTSGTRGENSSVRVLRGLRNDLAATLKLGAENAEKGATERDAVAAIRPVPQPKHGTLTSGVVNNAAINALDATHNSFKISLDGGPARTVTLPDTALAGTGAATRRAELANRIQTAVRALDLNKVAFKKFTCTVSPDPPNNRLVLASGTAGVTAGVGSSVMVSPAESLDVAAALNLVGADVDTFRPLNFMLQNGNEEPFTDEEAFGFYIGSQLEREGIFALDGVDLFNLMCLPGVSDPGILADAMAYCEQRRAFLIVDPPKGQNPTDIPTILNALPKSNYGAVYYPWVEIADPLKGGKLRVSPPSGIIAGLYARTDSARGVWKAPAGTEASLIGVQKLEYTLTDGENGDLNPLGVNCLRSFPVTGRVAWGARTLRGADQLADEYKYIPVRRLALFIEESLYRGTQWVVFEPNDEPLWAQIRLNVGAFMHNLFRQGAFQGKTPREAYLVKCDKETTTQNDINLGIVNILVGFAPLKPAEFVIIKVQQLAGQIAA